MVAQRVVVREPNPSILLDLVWPDAIIFSLVSGSRIMYQVGNS